MSKETSIIHYKAALTIFQKLFHIGIIAEKELIAIDTVIADKYGLSSFSIYRHSA